MYAMNILFVRIYVVRIQLKIEHLLLVAITTV